MASLDADWIGKQALVIQNMSKTYANGKRALIEQSFAIETGSCFGLLGGSFISKTSIYGSKWRGQDDIDGVLDGMA
jgi:ABC-type dipeptide/oligopeptide/nickel transport system ATPase subunit